MNLRNITCRYILNTIKHQVEQYGLLNVCSVFLARVHVPKTMYAEMLNHPETDKRLGSRERIYLSYKDVPIEIDESSCLVEYVFVVGKIPES